MSRNPWFLPTLLVLIWLVMICITNPIGNFPINDDWQYARPVSSLVYQGQYISPDSYSPIIIAQVFYGAIFCKFFGFSFTVLRISVLILGIIGVLVFYSLAKLFTNYKVAFMGALILLVNPLYFSLANSFMTDVPFLAFLLISMYFFIRSMESGARTYLIILATLFACIATLVRQFGVILPIAYAMALMLKEKPKVSQWIKYCIPSIITVGAYRIGLWWLAHIGSELKPYEGQQVGNFLSDILGLSNRMFDRIGLIIYYAAIFLLPLLVLLNLHRLRSFSIRQKTITGIILFAFCIPLIHMWNTVPCGNYVNGIFIGPKTIKHLLGDNLYYVSRLSHIIISIICFFCAVLLILNMIIAFKKQKAEPEDSTSIIFFQRIFIVFCLCGYSFLVFVFQAFFDRYLLLPIPLLFLLLISNTGIGISTDKRKLIAAYSIIILTGLITMLETHDYMEWNRSKWKALDYLTKECNISPHKIDGGYEFNGWYNIRSYDGKVGRSCVYVDDDEYIVTHNTAFNGYKIIKQFQYQNYFPFEEKTIYIFHRE